MASIQKIVVGGIIFIALIFTLTLAIQDITTVYEIPKSEIYFGNDTNSSKSIEKAFNITKEITESFDTSNIEQDNLDTVIVTGFNSIRTTLKIFPAVVQIFRYYASVLGIPTIILSIGVFILLFTISLSILLTILGRRDD